MRDMPEYRSGSNPAGGFNAIAGEALTVGALVAIHTDGKAYFANAITGGTQQKPAAGVAEVGVAAGDDVAIKPIGLIAGVAGLTIGAEVYMAETDGAVTSTAPSTSGDIVQFVGVALSATSYYLNVTGAYTTVA